MTYNEQEKTWKDLQRARNNLKRPTTGKKQPETTWNNLQRPEKTYSDLETAYNEQETTWNDPQGVRHNLQRPEPT